jgi:hypothetical protein
MRVGILGGGLIGLTIASAVAEITSNEGDGVWELKDENIIKHVAGDLDQRRITDNRRVSYSKVMRSRCDYMVDGLADQKNVGLISEYIDSIKASQLDYLKQ